MSKIEALVLKSVGSWYDVICLDGTLLKARLKGKLKIDAKKLTNPIAVGDKVLLQLEEKDRTQAIIEDILPRSNYIIRQSAHKTAHAHLIASNIDEVFLIVTLAFPQTSLGFIDRFLVAAESFGIKTRLIFNKSDLFDKKLLELYQNLVQIYVKIGYPCHLISAENLTNIEELKSLLVGKKILFSGHSGVGKSSLINILAPHLTQKTASISNFAQKGVHTTTFAEMFNLGNNTFIIDTPGIKEFGIVEIENEELAHYFPEMRAKIGQCKFNTCMHLNEPNCSVLSAIDKGEISISRYKSYVSMLENDDNRR
jgi:ribosome biogenesis GTPase / thiamine phosphate phosphatase